MVQKQLHHVWQRRPAVVKDPRQALLMALWRPLIPDLVCVFLTRDPVANAASLAGNVEKSAPKAGSGVFSPSLLL